MPLVPALCTQCGAKLEIDSNQEAAVCQFCQTPFITEKAINNYNMTNVTNIKTLHADVVNVSDDRSIDNRVRSGETFIKMDDYNSAHKIFIKLTEECPYDYRGWWGLIEVYSKNFTDMDISRAELLNIEKIFGKACTVATAEEKNAIEGKYRSYYDAVKNSLDHQMNEANQKIRNMAIEYNAKKTKLEGYINTLSELEKTAKDPSEIIKGVLFLAVVVIGFACAMTSTVTEFVVALIISGLVAWLVGSILCSIFNSIYIKRIKDLRKKRNDFQAQLETLTANHFNEIEPLKALIQRVGIEQ